jgi:hypothetical protein
MRRRPVPPVPRSVFAGFRVPPEVITVAVRCYLRYGCPTVTSRNSWPNEASMLIT